MFEKERSESLKQEFSTQGGLKSYNLLLKPLDLSVTDKITNKKYQKEFIPQYDEMSSKERYMRDVFGKEPKKILSDYRENKIVPKLDLRGFPIKKIDAYHQRSKTEYKLKRAKSLFNDKFKDKYSNYIFRNTKDSRTRKLYSMASNIFNQEHTSTNLINNKGYIKNKNHIHLGNEQNHVKSTLKYQKENKIINRSSFGLLKKEFDKNIMDRKIKNYNQYVKEKKFNKTSYLLKRDFNENEEPIKYEPFKKNNQANIESVKYDIISTNEKSPNKKYSNNSGLKPTSSKIQDYEMVLPNGFNKLNESKLKNILHAQGIHYFNFTEQGDIACGNKCRYKFKVRSSDLDKNHEKNIEKVSKKLSSIYSIKLQKTINNPSKKRTEVTKEYGPEVISNHLVSRNNKEHKPSQT